MKKSGIISLMTLLIAAFCTISAQAQGPDGLQRLKSHHIHQAKRIRNGIKSGDLNRREARRLLRKEARIRRDRLRAKSDGVVTPAERRQLRREERRTSREIFRLKHNNRKRHSTDGTTAPQPAQ